jgi:membrane protein implicated in regulation of membrane protease activity
MGLASAPGRAICAGMKRALLALFIGVVGFVLYVGAVVALADHVLPLHWTVQVLYFAVVGVLWAWPAKVLMFWAARQQG